MNILLLGDSPGAWHILSCMLGRTRHRLVQRAWEEIPEPNLEKYDIVLVDGNVGDCSQQARLLGWVREARRRFPYLPVAALNYVGSTAVQEEAEDSLSSRSCGVSESADGVLHMHCRLQELALNETAALLRDACERHPLEPIVFEYSGPN